MLIMKKDILLISSVIAAVVLFVGVGFVQSQSTGFSEPGNQPNLPAPLTTSDSPQTIESALGVGISSESGYPSDTPAFFVKGSTITGDGPFDSTAVAVESSVDLSDGALFNLQGSNVTIGGICPIGAAPRVCVVENTKVQPAVYIVQETGIGLFGETQASGKAGIYGEGFYGLYAKAAGNEEAIPLVGQSCTENQGSCIAPYGTAGFFNGDFVTQMGVGTITGDGRNLYKVGTLYNKEEDHYAAGVPGTVAEDDRSDGIAYKSYGVETVIQISAGATSNITSVVNVAAGERVMSIMAVEGDDQTTFVPAREVKVTYSEGTNALSLLNQGSAAKYVQLLVTYRAVIN